MTERLIAAAFLIMGGVTGLALSELILPFTRMQNTWLHVILVTVAGIFLFYVIAKQLRERFPNSVFGKSLQDMSTEVAAFGIGVLGVAFLTKSNNDVQFHVDNGTTAPVTFMANGKDSYTVQPGQSVHFYLPVGTNTLNVDGRDTTVDLTENRGHYIYNAGGTHVYFLGSIAYGDPETPPADDDKLDLISGILIHTNADYVFEAPEQIFVNRRDRGKTIQKKVLYRIKDVLEQMEMDGDNTGEEEPAAKGK